MSNLICCWSRNSGKQGRSKKVAVKKGDSDEHGLDKEIVPNQEQAEPQTNYGQPSILQNEVIQTNSHTAILTLDQEVDHKSDTITTSEPLPHGPLKQPDDAALDLTKKEKEVIERDYEVMHGEHEQPDDAALDLTKKEKEVIERDYEVMHGEHEQPDDAALDLTKKEKEVIKRVMHGEHEHSPRYETQSTYYLAGPAENTTVSGDSEYDYELPFFEPSNEEGELVCQISDLNVPIIPSSCVELVDSLGSGQFGMVYKGVWVKEKEGKEVSTKVAVKTLREEASEEDKIKFLQEAVIMGQFKQLNILGIHGIVVEGDVLKLVLDLMHKGDLKQHLSAIKQSIVGQTPSCALKQLLMSYTRQIVWGLSHLELKGYVHRDLAARNILVSDDGMCKIADFGLSRDLHNENYYKSHGGKIPVKWTAPEAILYKKYSTASDIWSYGCVLYEIWSLGEKPFSQHTNIQAIEALSNGYRLPPPPGLPKSLYSIMIDCWHPDPESRPTTGDIITKLQKPDFIYFQWDDSEVRLYSEESKTLCTPLENGHCLHVDLQRKYMNLDKNNRIAASTSS